MNQLINKKPVSLCKYHNRKCLETCYENTNEAAIISDWHRAAWKCAERSRWSQIMRLNRCSSGRQRRESMLAAKAAKAAEAKALSAGRGIASGAALEQVMRLQDVILKCWLRLEPLRSLWVLPRQHPTRILNQNFQGWIWASGLCKNSPGDADVQPGLTTTVLVQSRVGLQISSWRTRLPSRSWESLAVLSSALF